MPFTNFYNTNAERAFPFQEGTVALDSGPLSLLNLPNGAIVDAGFVLSAKSRFDASVHSVYLASIERQSDVFYFTFLSDAPELYDSPLVFSRAVDAEDWDRSDLDSEGLGLSDSSTSMSGSGGPDDPCNEALWYGYLVTGRMSDLALLLPSDGTVVRMGDAALLEPGLLQNLAGTYVTKFALANDDRTRTTGTVDCPQDPVPFEGLVHISSRCLLGDLVFVPGFNAVVSQDTRSNLITLGAAVGAGAGQPCAEIPLFDGETPPDDSVLFEGGPICNETMRSINGVGGPLLNLYGNNGVNVTSVPEENTIIVNVNLAGLDLAVEGQSDSC